MLLKAREGSLYHAHAAPSLCQVSALQVHDHAELGGGGEATNTER